MGFRTGLSGLRVQALTHKALELLLLHFISLSQAFGFQPKYILPKTGLFLVKTRLDV